MEMSIEDQKRLKTTNVDMESNLRTLKEEEISDRVVTTEDALSNRMQLPMIKARLRIKVNGPPTSMFQPQPVRKMWLHKGHQYAETATKKLVINCIRKQDKQNYTSKIFN